jgi:hypothetical protein
MTRKILYLRPTTWILVDEIETVAPMTFEARFHSDFPFASEGGSWHARGSRFGLRLTAGGTVPWVAQTSVHPCENVNGAVTRRYPLLTLEAQKVSRAALVTVLEVAPINSDPVPAPEFITTGDALNLSVTVATSRINLRIRTLLDNPLAIGVEF